MFCCRKRRKKGFALPDPQSLTLPPQAVAAIGQMRIKRLQVDRLEVGRLVVKKSKGI